MVKVWSAWTLWVYNWWRLKDWKTGFLLRWLCRRYYLKGIWESLAILCHDSADAGGGGSFGRGSRLERQGGCDCERMDAGFGGFFFHLGLGGWEKVGGEGIFDV